MITKNKYMQYQYVIAYLRQQVKRGIKQKDLAEALGKSNTYVNWLVQDKRKNKYIQQNIQKKIADYFDLSVDQLLKNGKKIFDQKNIKQIKGNNIKEIHLYIHFSGFKTPGGNNA